MGPVLALELSAEGIFLHELSYDGMWRQISVASLNDPSLPKKMSAMRAAARASQGRMFKNEVWVPEEQVILRRYELQSETEDARQLEALAMAADDPEIGSAPYIVRLGEEDRDGSTHVAFLHKDILAESVRFASGYGFGADGITTPKKPAGFHSKPYFDSAAVSKPLPPIVRRLAFGSVAAGVLAAAGYGGWLFYNSIEFSPNPATVIEAAEERVFSETEDPRAPIRPTAISQILVFDTPALATSGSTNESVALLDPRTTDLTVQVATATLGSTLTQIDAPNPASSISPISFWQEAPLQPAQSRPDSLPAPETDGFATVAPSIVALSSSNPIPDISLDLRGREYGATTAVPTLVETALWQDPLPAEESTVLLSALERKLNDGFGLTQVRDNDAEALRQVRIQEFQQDPPTVFANTRPDILPTLRSGNEVTDLIEAPEPVVLASSTPEPLSVFALQRLAPIVENGRPAITPTLRRGIEIGADPVVETPAPEPAPELTIAQLQNLTPVVLDGRPPISPTLRTGDDIGAAPPAPLPEPLTIAELQALEPIIVSGPPAIIPVNRPETVEGIPETDEENVALAAADPIEPLTLEELQNLAPDIIDGLPSTVPTLRVAADDTAADTPPPVPELTIPELQNLAAVVEEGRPQVLPTLRDGSAVDRVILTPQQEAELIASLQSEPPLVLNGRPPIVPILRESIDLGEGTGVVAPEVILPDQTEAGRYRPIFRPESIEDIARLNDPALSQSVVVSANAPPRRPADFDTKIEEMIQNFVEVPAAQPRFDDAPREVNLPTSASVAAAATIEDAVNLRATILIGVYGVPGSYRARIRQPGGRYLNVTMGESIGNGWRVVGIDESSIRVQKGNRTETLGLPG